MHEADDHDASGTSAGGGGGGGSLADTRSDKWRATLGTLSWHQFNKSSATKRILNPMLTSDRAQSMVQPPPLTTTTTTTTPSSSTQEQAPGGDQQWTVSEDNECGGHSPERGGGGSPAGSGGASSNGGAAPTMVPSARTWCAGRERRSMVSISGRRLVQVEPSRDAAVSTGNTAAAAVAQQLPPIKGSSESSLLHRDGDGHRNDMRRMSERLERLEQNMEKMLQLMERWPAGGPTGQAPDAWAGSMAPASVGSTPR